VSLCNALDSLLKCWEAIKVYFLKQGQNCNAVIWEFIGDQEDGFSTELTVPERILHFVHSHLFVFQKLILVLERNDIDVSELHDILSEAFNQISQCQEESFCGMNVNLRLLKFDQSQKTKFMKEADLVTSRAIAYLEKWTDFSDEFLICAKAFNLKKSIPSINDFIQLAGFSNIDISSTGKDELFSEVCSFNTKLQVFIF
jgi:hypothetical protein